MENTKCHNHKPHTPDWKTVRVDYDGEIYLDVRCMHCSTWGCVGNTEVLLNQIEWETLREES